MVSTAPHYLLIAESFSNPARGSGGRWRFVLEQIGGSQRIEAANDEPMMGGERLALLAVVRGLEALDQPSRVTLITPSRHVGNGLRRGLDAWRENGWCWERFGQMTPIKHRDLWQRIDRAMQFHQVECRVWNLERLRQEVEHPSVPEIDRIRDRFAPVRNRIRWARERLSGLAARWSDRLEAGNWNGSCAAAQ